MEIKIEPSRPQPYVGSGLGITALFKNTSKSAVLYLADETTTLTMPPEVEGPFQPVFGRTAFFPSENDQWRENDARIKADPQAERKPAVIVIRPGYTYRAAWVVNAKADEVARAKASASASSAPPPEVRGGLLGLLWSELAGSDTSQQVAAEMPFLFFVPGDYKAMVQAKVGVGESPLSPSKTYYTFSETAVIKVGAPQSVILLGAMLGGLVSWLLFPQGEPKSVTDAFSKDGFAAAGGKVFWWIYSIAGACLLSAIVTVLLARLSDSQFLVKISVNDFWGALVVGFIAQYAGKSILDKIIPGRLKSQDTKASRPKEPTKPGGGQPISDALP